MLNTSVSKVQIVPNRGSRTEEYWAFRNAVDWFSQVHFPDLNFLGFQCLGDLLLEEVVSDSLASTPSLEVVEVTRYNVPETSYHSSGKRWPGFSGAYSQGSSAVRRSQLNHPLCPKIIMNIMN
jgi:hypothetical protein